MLEKLKLLFNYNTADIVVDHLEHTITIYIPWTFRFEGATKDIKTNAIKFKYDTSTEIIPQIKEQLNKTDNPYYLDIANKLFLIEKGVDNELIKKILDICSQNDCDFGEDKSGNIWYSDPNGIKSTIGDFNNLVSELDKVKRGLI